MENHTHPEPSQPALTNKEQIANLAKMVACFYPVFVNESNEEGAYSISTNPKRSPNWKWNGKFKPRPQVENVPDLDAFLNTCAGAVMGMREFIGEHETLIAKFDDMAPKHSALTSDAMLAHQMSMQKGVSAPSLAEAMETWIGRFLQAIDVFKSIYETPCVQDAVALRFQQAAHEFAKRFINPGFLKCIGGGLSDPPSPIPQSETDGGGDEDKTPHSGQ